MLDQSVATPKTLSSGPDRGGSHSLYIGALNRLRYCAVGFTCMPRRANGREVQMQIKNTDGKPLLTH
jgi:hypothetical protein